MISGATNSTDGDVSNNDGGGEGWLVMIDSSASIIWEKTYGGTDGERFVRVFRNSENGYYLIGATGSSDGDVTYNPYPDFINYWIVKTDSLGNIIWDRVVGGNGGDHIVNGTITSDDGIIAIGYSLSEDGDVSVHYGSYDMWMIKLNSEGETEWDFTIGNTAMDFPGEIIETSDGGYLVGGSSEILSGGNLTCETHGLADAVLIKLDSLRNIEWQHCYGGSDYDGASVLLELEDGYIFDGYTYSNDGDISGYHGNGDIWIVRVDFFGNIIWQKCLGGGSPEGSKFVIQTEDNGFIVTGITSSTNGDVTNNHSHPGLHDIWVVKLTGEGELEWQQCFGGDRDEMVNYGVHYKGNSNLVIAGETENVSGDVMCNFHGWQENDDYWVFEISIPDTTNTTTYSMNENGFKVYPNPAGDYVVFEFSPAAIKNGVISSRGAGNSAGVRNPPANTQPANKTPAFKGSGNSQGVSHSNASKPAPGFDMTVVVVNIFGQELARLPVKAEKTVWDCREVQNGIYFYRVEIDGKVVSGKVVVQN